MFFFRFKIFKNNLVEKELNKINLIFSELDKMWEKDFKEYKSISILTDEKIIVKWNEGKGVYDEIK